MRYIAGGDAQAQEREKEREKGACAALYSRNELARLVALCSLVISKRACAPLPSQSLIYIRVHIHTTCVATRGCLRAVVAMLYQMYPSVVVII